MASRGSSSFSRPRDKSPSYRGRDYERDYKSRKRYSPSRSPSPTYRETSRHRYRDDYEEDYRRDTYYKKDAYDTYREKEDYHRYRDEEVRYDKRTDERSRNHDRDRYDDRDYEYKKADYYKREDVKSSDFYKREDVKKDDYKYYDYKQRESHRRSDYEYPEYRKSDTYYSDSYARRERDFEKPTERLKYRDESYPKEEETRKRYPEEARRHDSGRRRDSEETKRKEADHKREESHRREPDRYRKQDNIAVKEEKREDSKKEEKIPDDKAEDKPLNSTTKEPQTHIEELKITESVGPSPMSTPGDDIGSMIWQYQRLSQIGEGTYGKVYKAVDTKTGKLVAMKRIRMENEKEGFPITAIREIQLLNRLKGHTNIVSLLEIRRYQDVQVYLVFEYASHDLSAILQHPAYGSTLQRDWQWIRSILFQCLSALSHLHTNSILHRDIKSSNLLVDKDGTLKLADFGLARDLSAEVEDKPLFAMNCLTNRVITLWYRPPELLLGTSCYGPDVDTWAVGCLALELLIGKHPFQGSSELNQLDAIYSVLGTPDLSVSKDTLSSLIDDATFVEPTLNLVADVPPLLSECPLARLFTPTQTLPSTLSTLLEPYSPPDKFVSLVNQLLTMEPRDRISASDALSHPFFSEPCPLVPLPSEMTREDWHEFKIKKLRKRKQ